jgi:hypothetical protein
MCLSGTSNNVHIGKNMSTAFPIQNGLMQVSASSPLLFNFTLEYVIRKVWNSLENISFLCMLCSRLVGRLV